MRSIVVGANHIVVGLCLALLSGCRSSDESLRRAYEAAHAREVAHVKEFIQYHERRVREAEQKGGNSAELKLELAQAKSERDPYLARLETNYTRLMEARFGKQGGASQPQQ